MPTNLDHTTNMPIILPLSVKHALAFIDLQLHYQDEPEDPPSSVATHIRQGHKLDWVITGDDCNGLSYIQGYFLGIRECMEKLGGPSYTDEQLLAGSDYVPNTDIDSIYSAITEEVV